MFRSLADKGINIQAITTSEIKVSVLIDEAYTELAVRACTRPMDWKPEAHATHASKYMTRCRWKRQREDTC